MQEPKFKTVGELSGINKVTPIQIQKEKRNILPIVMAVLVVLTLLILIWTYTLSRNFAAREAEAAHLASIKKLNDVESQSLYNGYAGGLYSDLSNEVPDAKALVELQKNITPLDKEGQKSKDGKIGMVIIGEPYTKGEVSMIQELAKKDPGINPNIEFIEATEAKQGLREWEQTSYPWDNLSSVLVSQGLSTSQVQIFWISLGFWKNTESFPDDIAVFTESMNRAIMKAEARYPNLKLFYLSSPRYAGISENLDYQEPNNYEAGYGVRNVMNNYETKAGVLWGPYMWNDDITGNTDFSYTKESYLSDGVSFSTSGKQRFAVDVLEFFKEYEFSKAWFLRQESH